VGTLPPIALEISGVTYQLEDNPFGWVDISFHFQPGSSVATIHMSEEPELVVGLDNRYRLTVDPESKSRPIGLRGSWEANDTFRVEDITLGEFSKAEVIARFDWDSLSLTVFNLNYRDEPVVITGHRQP